MSDVIDQEDFTSEFRHVQMGGVPLFYGSGGWTNHLLSVRLMADDPHWESNIGEVMRWSPEIQEQIDAQ